jgi:hypothetical protein
MMVNGIARVSVNGAGKSSVIVRVCTRSVPTGMKMRSIKRFFSCFGVVYGAEQRVVEPLWGEVLKAVKAALGPGVETPG